MTTAESPRRRWAPYLWLVYLLFFLRPLFLEPTPAWLWAVSGIALGLFLWLYFTAYRVRGLALALCIGGIFGIGAALAPLNPGATCFLVYAVAFLHRVERVALASAWLLTMIATAATMIWGLGLPLGAILIVMLTVGGAGISMAELERKNLALRRSRDESTQFARIAERERIRRDLHDLLGHTLSVIVLKSELAAKVADSDPRRSGEEIRDVERISRNALADVRAAVSGYRAQGLSGELANARRVLEGAGVLVSCEVDPVDLTAAQESAVSLALREAVTNVVRHAGATRCRIRLHQEGGRIRLAIEDDGKGGALTEGSGLAGMRARVAALGGSLVHEGRSGWHLAISLPADAGSADARLATASPTTSR